MPWLIVVVAVIIATTSPLLLLVILRGWLFSGEEREQKKGLIVALEGNISAGKSSLSKILATSSDFIVIPEYVDPHLLRLFYQDMGKYAFLLQLATKARRVGEVNMSIICKSNKVHIHDGCLLRDIVFALNHWLSGNMNATETDIYGSCNYLKNIMITLQQIDKVMYLHTNPERCKKAALSRGDVDKDIDVGYLALIDHLHFHGIMYLALQGKDVNILDWNNFGAGKGEIISFFQDNLKESVKVSYDDYDEKESSVDNGDYHIVYMASALEALPPSDVLFPRLPAEYRFVFTSRAKQEIVKAFTEGKRVILSKRWKCLIDIFGSLSDIMHVS